MRYPMKAVLFDCMAECRELIKELEQEGILVLTPFLGLDATEALQKELADNAVLGTEALLLTNSEPHARAATKLCMAVAGCMEGHFEVPKTTVLLESPGEVSIRYLNRIFCHAQGLPAMVAETERLYLRELTKEDMDALYGILTEPEVGKYLPAKTGSREEELEKLISYVACVYPFFEYGYWGIYLKETDELIGRAGFKEGSYPPEAGYIIRRSLWGNGYATEVLRVLLRYAEEELCAEEVVLKIDPENAASRRVADKCGFLQKSEEIYVRLRSKEGS